MDKFSLESATYGFLLNFLELYLGGLRFRQYMAPSE